MNSPIVQTVISIMHDKQGHWNSGASETMAPYFLTNYAKLPFQI